MSRYLNGSQKPPIPRIAENGWGPEYPFGMTDLDLLVYSPTMYDLYRTNGGMGSGMVDRFPYDPITQYGNLSSGVADGMGSSDVWFSLMNHIYPYGKYPFTSVENMESNYNQPHKKNQMGIAEKTGTGFFTSLNEESNLIAEVQQPRSGNAMMPPATVPTTTTPKICPAGQQLFRNKCVPSPKNMVITNPRDFQVQPKDNTLPPAPIVNCPSGYVKVSGICMPILTVPVQAAPVGGGGGGGEAPAETTGEKGAEMGIEKISYTIPLLLAVIGAVGGYFYAQKAGKKIAVFAAGGAIIGFAAGYFYTKFKMKKDSEAASKAQ